MEQKIPNTNVRLDECRVTRIMLCLRDHCDGATFELETVLSELNLDSLELIESLFEIENFYGKTLSNAELASLVTVEDLVKAFATANRES